MIYKEYTGVVVAVDSPERLGRVKVRIPFLHGGDYNADEPTNEQSIKNQDLPWATVDSIPNTNSNVPQPIRYKQGEEVIIIFYDQEYDDIPGQQPHVVRKASDSEVAQAKNSISTRAPVCNQETTTKKLYLYEGNPCDKGKITPVYGPPSPSVKVANGKCGQQSKIKGSFSENIADFLQIVQNTNGKVGTQFVSKYTGELFNVLGYVKKYTASILGIFRDGLKWIKATITKYVRMAIDELVKALIVPIKGILDVVQPILEDALNKIGCSFGDIERNIADLIEKLLLALVGSGLNAVFGCLDTLVDGILNQILSSVSTLIDSIFSSIQAIAGLVGNIGDLAGQALSAVLDILGISCGGAGDCTSDGQKSFTLKLFSNDEYGIPNDIKTGLQSGLNAINNVQKDILTGAQGLDALQAGTSDLDKSTQLGTANFNDRSTFNGQTINNRALNRAINVAQSLIPTGNLSSFCNNLAASQDTSAVIIGTPVRTNNSVYSVFNRDATKNYSGSPVNIRVTRDLANSQGVILVVGYKGTKDTVRISSPGVIGDVNIDASFKGTDFVSDSRITFGANDVFFFRKLVFAENENYQDITIPTNTQSPIDSTTETVTFSVGVFRAADDVKLDNLYPGDNLPNSSSALNTANAKIYFNLPPRVVPSGPTLPPLPYITTLSGTTTSGTTGSNPNCVPNILITSQPLTTIVAKNGDSLSISTIARSTVAGYTLNYQWQKTKNIASGWTNITDGTVNTTVSSKTQVYGVIATGTTVTGSGYTLYGYKDASTQISISTSYTGSSTQILNINPVSYYDTDSTYYRCIVSSPTLSSAISNPSLIRVTSQSSFLIPVVTTSGSVITNPNNTEPGLSPPTASGVVCVPYTPPTVSSGTTPTVSLSGITTISGTPAFSVPNNPPIVGIPSPSNPLPAIAPVIVGPDGGVNNISIPDNLPKFSSPPLISITGPGAGATAKAILDDLGNLSKIIVTSRGFGYTPSTNKLCGILDSIEIISTGAFFTSSPTVYVSGDSSIAVADIDEFGKVVLVRIVNPQNKVFDTIPKIEIYGGNGVGASGKAIIKYVDCATVADEYDRVLNRYKTTKRGMVKVVDCP